MSNTMREILFRGKWVEWFDNERRVCKEWVYGSFVPETHEIIECSFDIDRRRYIKLYYEVDTSTVGMYTGLTDKNGTKIFEGDILLAGDGDTYVVEYRNDWTAFTARQFGGNPNYNPFLFTISDRCKIIGNIHDNPELLKQE